MPILHLTLRSWSSWYEPLPRAMRDLPPQVRRRLKDQAEEVALKLMDRGKVQLSQDSRDQIESLRVMIEARLRGKR